MKLYLDTEFNGFGGELLSLALVHETGYWYEVKTINSPYHPWVKEHVVPFFYKPPLRPLIFKSEFQRYITQFENPEIICDWHEDAIHFLNLMNGNDYGSSLNLDCKITIIRTPPDTIFPRIPHNAMSDAQALMEWYEKR